MTRWHVDQSGEVSDNHFQIHAYLQYNGLQTENLQSVNCEMTW